MQFIISVSYKQKELECVFQMRECTEGAAMQIKKKNCFSPLPVKLTTDHKPPV